MNELLGGRLAELQEYILPRRLQSQFGDELLSLEGNGLAAAHKNAVWPRPELLGKIVAGHLTEIVADFEAEVVKSRFRFVEWTNTDNNRINTTIFSHPEEVKYVWVADW
ncbi:hypothetical protein I6J77_13685 [Rhodanobacter sp. FDAARGOS 1247]|uniref:hypothetical protein n=1 Tax=Rhodanobacter sp. FDAARGOS 1247 TaxID=2778082 RepID=UPI001951B65B|nr:hypothetical protein [Rhodanobacter sp. FDAARGOS 1247]QRP63158.1 hypothetical protein I6J77_13685 [Rhodanobacter sp. FDAARGOS 1247]